MSIHILDSQTANSIAAGEVVERPASVVKELLENALDAGAGSIRCEIDQGGIKRLLLRDNGCGMLREDAEKAFLRHATSKLRSIDDLNHISSMGFRGEALASIAAVSKLSLRTRPPDEELGTEITYEGGQLIKSSSCGCPEGSVFEVRELFYNTPARYKFLKRDATEAAYVHDLCTRIAFTRPDVSLRFIKDGKELFLTPGNSEIRDLIYTLWGKESSDGLRDFKREDESVRVHGFLSRSSLMRRNRSRQVCIVNGRVIHSPLIRTAVDQACRSYYVKGNFPELLLYLDLPAPLLDVNVHPQKTEVRFWDEQEVFRAVYHALNDCLENFREMPVAVLSKYGVYKEIPAASQDKLAGDAEQSRAEVEQKDIGREYERAGQMAFGKPLPAAAAAPAEKPLRIATEYERLPADEQAFHFAELAQTPREHKSSFDAEQKPAGGDLPAGIQRLMSARLIGQIFNSYLLLEEGDSLLLIDQHAAHERILYEKLLQGQRESAQGRAPSQLLLRPLMLPLSLSEQSVLEAEEELIRDLGFDFDFISQNSIALRAVPQAATLEEMDAESALRALLEKAAEKRLDPQSELEEIYHSMACKSAVKAHDILSYAEMQALFRQLQQMQDPFHCPHGRPLILRLSRRELEKLFLRSL